MVCSTAPTNISPSSRRLLNQACRRALRRQAVSKSQWRNVTSCRPAAATWRLLPPPPPPLLLPPPLR
eukprot:4807463-Heterocapsa_arctica.AAC.1